MSLSKSFFSEDTEKVAKELLGCRIKINGIEARIIETEAYLGKDPASHAYPTKTKRNRLMYETHGKVYIYLCYGIHYMLNFTAEKDGVGGILIRALEPIEGIERMQENRGVEEKEDLCNGPGKVCEALEISMDMNGSEIGEDLEIKERSAPAVEASPRIGVSKAEDRELRFYIPGNQYVSRR